MTVLSLEVSQDGSIANWIILGKFAPGDGGADDLLVGAKHAAIQHTTVDGQLKLLKEYIASISKGVLDLGHNRTSCFGFQDGTY